MDIAPSVVDILVEECIIGESKRTSNSCYVPITTKYGNPIRFETPEMRVVFDLKPYTYPKSKTTNYTLNLELDTYEPEVYQMLEFMKGIDSVVKSVIEDEWKRSKPKIYSPVKIPDNKAYYPYLRCKMDHNKTKFKLKMFEGDTKMNPTIEEVQSILKSGAKVKCILQLTPIWKAGFNSGISVQVKQIQVTKRTTKEILEPGEEMIHVD